MLKDVTPHYVTLLLNQFHIAQLKSTQLNITNPSPVGNKLLLTISDEILEFDR